MELRNKSGEVAKLADNLTLKEIVDMGFSLDICDEAYDPNEHWKVKGTKPKGHQGEYPEK
ncbi:MULTISPECIES: hypothetical protein [Photobacterium]|uniref:Uncharacterized protein n=1 Tax=Photobacterium ganghwense TaxID=320778 RepID=A0A0J1HG02_9GAMM|nr:MULTISPECIES: hypothetical protein [Photobacterium]KLV10573.1 hypothetical protein ABT57_08600 [Photobacterium ganghwense]MBV1843241.1 hypothetical protein [Photobacterium ganghwense]PSU09522.1 hypothetical protein C9I92_08285 [Photobacterium ganghwense]QSV16769.1 hypothetical protein FH974_17520 [Photobacterium ganghwense]